MKALLVLAFAATTMGGFTFSRMASPKTFAAQQGNTSSHPQRESPFACDTMALSPQERKRHFQELGPTLRSLRKNVRELSDGYEFEFPPDPTTFQLLAEWAIQERSCCPFFDIDLRLEREGGSFWLRLSGREGTKDFIRVDGAAWIKQ